MGEQIEIAAKDGGSFMAHLEMPSTTPAGTIIVIQEIFGVNQGLREKCSWLASEGFIAVCPDLFWRLEPGIELTDKTEEEWAKAFDLFNRFDVDLGIEDLRAVMHTFKGHALGNGKVGCLGYCLGGKLAYMMAARSDVDASVSYYGVGLDEMLDEAANIKKPLLMHIAEQDKFVPKEAQEKITTELSDHNQVIMHTYEGLDHAFTRVGGEHYDEAGAKLADGRSIDFLRQSLDQALAA